MEDEVDAIKRQLKLLGHSVPTDVIVKFLQDNNELYTLEAAASNSDRLAHSLPSAQPFGGGDNNARASPSKVLLPSLDHQISKPANLHVADTPQLDTTWAGQHDWSERAHHVVSCCSRGVRTVRLSTLC